MQNQSQDCFLIPHETLISYFLYPECQEYLTVLNTDSFQFVLQRVFFLLLRRCSFHQGLLFPYHRQGTIPLVLLVYLLLFQVDSLVLPLELMVIFFLFQVELSR